jgi:AraC-like DNA-binding protein
MARLHNLHEAAINLATTVPDILAHREVSRATEQELVRATVACLADSGTIKKPMPNRQRIMQRFHQVIEANQYEPLYLTEICAAVGVTERTLRSACMDYLGLGPHRYLWLRRMNVARRALVLADPKAKSVTEIANDYGFGELGRFAVAYRALYGESPSATLRHSD